MPAADPPAGDRPLQDRRVLVALTGGIACYKSATVVSRLVQRGAILRVIMTDAATRFITPLTLQSLSGQPVLSSIWDRDDRPDSQHIGLARWAEVIAIAPLSANSLAKLAHGLCDDLVSLVACARPAETPLLVAPAMNADMWASPVVQRNLAMLRELPAVSQVGPEAGWQACRTAGDGRMAEPEAIIQAITQSLG
jgi:phosphopantothenoylcysteine decarboxylase/phosphopantothenate--cysteine ligase